MLDCCEPLEKVKEKGISFGKLVCLAHCAGAKVEAFRTNHSTIDNFRSHVLRCSISDDCHVISSYHRGTFKQVSTNLNCFGFCRISFLFIFVSLHVGSHAFSWLTIVFLIIHLIGFMQRFCLLQLRQKV